MGRKHEEFNAYSYDPETYNAELLKRAGQPTYQDIPLIVKDVDVRNRVYYGFAERGEEAIVVDIDADPDIYVDFANFAINRSRNERQRIMRPRVPRAVFDTVSEKMPGSADDLDRFYKTSQLRNGDTVGLSTYMRGGFGVCRHKALVCAAILEILKTGGYAPGFASVDSSSRRLHGINHHTHDHGHMWARYEDPDGEIWILDPENGLFGTLNESATWEGWNYFRPEDELERIARLHRKLGQRGLGGFLNRMRWLARGE